MDLTYNTPTAEQLNKLSQNCNRKYDERLESDCKYLLNTMNKVLNESLDTEESFTHSVKLNRDKFNSTFVRLEDCSNTKYNIIQEMKNVGVSLEKINSLYVSAPSICYRKISKKMDIFI